MGNYCSTGINKKNLDNDSEKSEDSPSYQLNDKRKKQKKNGQKKEAPLADPEPISDISVNAQNIVGSPNNGQDTKALQKQLTSDGLATDEPMSASPHTLTAPCPLPTVTKTLPTNLQPLHGKISTTRRTEKDKKIILYVLAPDQGADYNLCPLHKIYDLLRQKCESRGFELQISNLHNTSQYPESTFFTDAFFEEGPLEARCGHALAANCLAEIARQSNNSYLIPVLYLGNELGAQLLPLTIESQDFRSVLSTIEMENPESRVLLEKWYKEDTTAQPACYRLESMPEEPARTKEWSALLLAMIMIFTKELRDSYFASLVEQEINNTVLFRQELAKRCIWIQTAQPVPADGKASLETEIYRRLGKFTNDLKSQLTEKHILKSTSQDRIEQSLTQLGTLLSEEIDAIIEEHSTKFQIPYCTFGVDRRLFAELEDVSQHSKILGQSCADCVVLDKAKKYLLEGSTKPLVIYGKSGSGKSVVTAMLAQNVHSWIPDCCLVLRYGKLTMRSSTLEALLQSICSQLSVIVKDGSSLCRHDVSTYSSIIEDCLMEATSRMVILIDSLDSLSNGDNLDWMPANLKENVKIIVTVTTNATDLSKVSKDSSDNSESLLYALKDKIQCDDNFVLSSAFTETQWMDVINTGGSDFYAANGALHLPNEWKTCVDKTPIQAKILWWLAWLGVKFLKNTSLDFISKEIFEQLEKRFTKRTTSHIISLIIASPHGIMETELMELIGDKLEKSHGSPAQLWLSFSWFMGPLLRHSNNVSIMDRLIHKIAKERYSAEVQAAHITLHDYYSSRESTFVSSSGKTQCLNMRKYMNLPYHAYHKNQSSFATSSYLTDLTWIYNKIKCTGCIHMLSDIALCSDAKAEHLRVLDRFIRDHFSALNYDVQQFYSLLKAHLRTVPDGDATVGSWRKALSENDVICLEYVKEIDLKSESSKNASDALMKCDAIINLSGQGYFVASIRTEKEEICIWDVARCCRVRTFSGIPQPSAICPVGDYGAAVLCRREIKVLDLDNGCFKVTLKGVMNQKMPYFGLHDAKHLACLSRNRMYVNLMNLESGDCVTTFKAGEDRFLNSLLISGDGRILVCGDETQKPFPLLVWHLTQRKLLYDLRIPHHDFITSLSAITHEGSYVCVVAKELAEPAPNFIVVYDLQSGTLFKKWKPSCNTESLAISQTMTCVIAGLEDARIFVWDLVTGNCKLTLMGHNAPVTLLKLDPTGKVLLSGDKEGRDPSIRIWDLDTGTSLAVFTPSHKISTCEILSEGKYVVIALENQEDLVTLSLKKLNATLDISNKVTYGKEENEGKTFDLQKQ
uniref:Putative angio-associated migratory cell protein n=1 Tax=Phlebotomus kandelakii TaxID=1109342 RepID=A0A6B2E7D3_9DIPT